MKNSRNGYERISTGIPALDEITYGGLPKGELYVVNGAPGTGKTVLALHFLSAGVEAGETCLCIALSQRVESIYQTGASVGIDTTGIIFRELSSAQALETVVRQQTIFDVSEVELEHTMRELTQIIESVQPQRVVFDSISYLRMLANNVLIYRRQLLILRDFLASHEITVMLTDTQELVPGDGELEATAHGVIKLSKITTGFGSQYRYLQISKIRGSGYQSDLNDMKITDQGMQVYPLFGSRPRVPPQAPTRTPITSGLEHLDRLLGDGMLSGTSCLLIGPSGTGKTSIATAFAHQALLQGDKISIFLFDELTDTFLQRTEGLNMEVDPYKHPEQVHIHELGLGAITPGQFTCLVEQEVNQWGARIVIIDSLTGYTNAMPSPQKVITQMHELLIGLNRRDVLTLLVVAQHGVLGPGLDRGVDISYLADTVLLLRHFEADGALHRAISVYKKRYGTHEMGIREVTLGANGIHIGEPLKQFTGILSGTPQFMGEKQALIDNNA
jgi:circadian clock protein KaiC